MRCMCAYSVCAGLGFSACVQVCTCAHDQLVPSMPAMRQLQTHGQRKIASMQCQQRAASAVWTAASFFAMLRPGLREHELSWSATCAGVTLLGAVLTWLTYAYWGPWTCANVPLMDKYMQLAPLIQPPLFAVAGVAHFITHEEFCRFYPHQVRLATLHAALHRMWQ